MLRYWSSRRYSTLRTLVLLAADFSSSTNSVIPRAVSLRVSISQSTGILGIPLPALLSNMFFLFHRSRIQPGSQRVVSQRKNSSTSTRSRMTPSMFPILETWFQTRRRQRQRMGTGDNIIQTTHSYYYYYYYYYY